MHDRNLRFASQVWYYDSSPMKYVLFPRVVSSSTLSSKGGILVTLAQKRYCTSLWCAGFLSLQSVGSRYAGSIVAYGLSCFI